VAEGYHTGQSAPDATAPEFMEISCRLATFSTAAREALHWTPSGRGAYRGRSANIMDGFTDSLKRLPILNSKLTERFLVSLCAGPAGQLTVHRALRPLSSLHKVDRVLVVSDVNIGDSLITKPAVAALAAELPETEIDYICHHKTASLIEGDPDIHQTLGLFRGGRKLDEATLSSIRALLGERRYDVILNFCPFLRPARLPTGNAVVIGALPVIIRIMSNHGAGRTASLPFNVVKLMHEVLDRIPSHLTSGERLDDVPVSIYLDGAHAESVRFVLERTGAPPEGNIVFVNPDTSNYTTFAGAGFWSELCTRLLASEVVDGLLLGRGFTQRAIEDEILDDIPEALASQVVVCPQRLSLEDFTALSDRCRVFISGDTGPLHLAAARKFDPQGKHSYRNRTAVVGVFKATDPRIYGYDSSKENSVAAAQDAPSWSLEAKPECKNLSCSLQRITQTCPADRCQDALDPAAAAALVVDELRRQAKRPAEQAPVLSSEAGE
jgi:ADP-heptose:LPS heptosyltransferase